jgi:alpha-L-rhamnosidase
MDCPSRERSGYLCDSFFTSRVERALTGASTVEKQFLSNFIMPGQLATLPQGMLPMCYPADVVFGLYIPNWAMWYVVQLDEYLKRTEDIELVEAARERVYALCRYFEGFENELGLLEKLRGWVFVEWSRCNDLVQDVSFPSNMMYCAMLSCVARLYGDDAAAKKAQKIKDTINSMAVTDSGFYCDNALRGADGKLYLSGERTETCQYYAFFCGIATPETHGALWQRLVDEFGSDRDISKTHTEIYPSAPFIGNYLRLELLNRYGYKEKLYSDIRGYFEYMADRTGTLWEHAGVQASCNHGFASHVIYWMKSLGLVE